MALAMLTTDIKGLFSIKIKSREDTFTDQYHRVFMVKILLACTMVMGISWYTDSINCIMPEEQANSEEFVKFVSQACWVNGLYIYRYLSDKQNISAYYGIPRSMDVDGVYTDKKGREHLCVSTAKIGIESTLDCQPMEKTFFTQYQWMPFLICTFALLYYIPYMMYKTINHDLIKLGEEASKDKPEVKKIVKFYFKDRHNQKKSNAPTVRQLINLLIKISYLVINILVFMSLNNLLYGEFKSYGSRWISYSKYNNSIALDYMGDRDFPKPGNELLPPFGYCEVWAQSMDVKVNFKNEHKMVCEMSQHTLYQYVFILIWFVIVVGFVVSIIGILQILFHYIYRVGRGQRRSNHSFQKISDTLTYREMEYLEYLGSKNIPVHGEVLEALKERCNPSSVGSSDYDDLPKYPGNGKAPTDGGLHKL